MKPTLPPDMANGKTPPACIWKQAGVVARKSCGIDYQCAACRYDKKMRQAVRENRTARDRGIEGRPGTWAGIVSWKDRLRELPPWKRPCLHSMKGRIGFRACTNDYRCADCEFDQYFDDQFTVHAVVTPVDELDIEGFKVPQGYYLHRGHAWVKIEEEKTVRIGLDDFAARTFGPFSQIDTPLLGQQVTREQPGITLTRGNRTARVLSPVSGVITATNPAIFGAARALDHDMYTRNWLVRVDAADLRRDLKHLMIRDEASAFFEKEIARLYQVIEETAGPLATDGGHLTSDLCGQLPQLDWEKLTRIFLRT
ncbi:MAG: glycine cleavage system protein H [Desulfobacterales bacterium]